MYDAIVIGAGHNGLVCAAYLARAGLKPLVLERRAQVGGAAVTEEPWPGFRVSSLSYVTSLLLPKVVQDLELERHGYHVWEMAPDYFVPFPDGRSLVVWSEADRTAAEIGRFSTSDAEAYLRFDETLSKMALVARRILTLTPPRLGSHSPPDLVSLAGAAWRFRRLGIDDVGGLAKLMGRSIADLLDEYFESEEVKASLASQGVIGAFAGPRSPGTAYVMLHHWMGEVNGNLGSWGVVRGGMGTLSDAIAEDLVEHGGEVRVGTAVARVLTSAGRATGVVLDDGSEIRAPLVVSNLHPKTTYLELLEPADVPSEVRRHMEHFITRSGTVKINLALSRLPNFTSRPGEVQGSQHTGTIELLHSIDYVERAFEDAKQGRAAARPYAEMVIPTCYDPTIAPAGKHIAHIFAQYVPAEWADQDQQAELEAFADRVIGGFSELAPGFDSLVEQRQVIGPHEIQVEYGLIGGNIMHGDLELDQLFSWRPHPRWPDYRSPVEGFYLCGSGTHPGGGVTGAPGHNAAREILRDRRRGRRSSKSAA
ncbi:MAG: NAD(P)/FAD-dependent oxidoreductase [Acidimicrobiia bacterium]|nr:NAD(P)/FAD-dependent oxidoreductase [Acidimicrobiia bacterium]